MDYEEEQSNSPRSLKDRLRRSLSHYCCFPTRRRHSLSSDKTTLLRASSTWIKSRAHDLPEIGDLIGRRRSPSSADFSYDPLSYALNFDDSDDSDAPLRSFSVARVPPLNAVPEMKEIFCA